MSYSYSIVCFFSIPLQSRCTYRSFHFLSVLFCGQPVQQSPQFCKFSLFFFFFFVDYYKVCSSGRDQSIIIIIIIIIIIHWHVVFDVRLSDSKSPEISGTLLSILADFNTVSWFFFCFPIPPVFLPSLKNLSNWINWYRRHPHVLQLFNPLARSKYFRDIYHLVLLSFIFAVRRDRKIH